MKAHMSHEVEANVVGDEKQELVGNMDSDHLVNKVQYEGTIVPDSQPSKAVDSGCIKKLWEGNQMADWRVLGMDSWTANEDVGMVQPDEEVRMSTDRIPDERDHERETRVAVSPIWQSADLEIPAQAGPQKEIPRANIATIVKHNG
ncbi:hypothetical protein V6N13_059666 [Hibiscus sabdariffa]